MEVERFVLIAQTKLIFLARVDLYFVSTCMDSYDTVNAADSVCRLTLCRCLYYWINYDLDEESESKVSLT